MAQVQSKPDDGTDEQRIVGLLRIRNDRSPLAGCHIRACIETDTKDFQTLAAGFSHLDGGFILSLDSKTRAVIDHDDRPLLLVIENRFGRVIDRYGPIKRPDVYREHVIDVEFRPEDDLPVAPSFLDPFITLEGAYSSEIAALKKAGVLTWDSLIAADLQALSGKLGIPDARFEAFRLHGEMNTASQGFDAEAATLLVSVGIKGRSDLARSEAQNLARVIQHAVETGTVKSPNFSALKVPTWIAIARGWDLSEIARDYSTDEVVPGNQAMISLLNNTNPQGEAISVLLSDYWAQLQAVAELRGVMTAVGVYDLSALSPFVVRGSQLIQPGYHFSLPSRNIVGLSDPSLLQAIVARGAGFTKVKAVQFTNYGVHILPNPVRDAVILGPLVQFIENGELVIGKEVTSLTIITDAIDYRVVNRIRYEGADQTPPPQPGFNSARPGPPRPFPTANDRTVYTPDGKGDNGRDGLSGINGASGTGGFSAEPAPSLKLYVRSTPNGIPDIDVNGRSGGRGQDAQDGGNGEDGAKGRESVGTFWLFCVSEVGHGGHGGDGGRGGDGGPGGMGGAAGSVALYSPIENLISITKRNGFFLGITGGRGGEGGQGGGPGAAGVGGEAGHDTAGCDAHPDWHGLDGIPGGHGNRGSDGQSGSSGLLSFVPITLDQWNAAFHFPFLIRLEPAAGPPGTKVRAVGLNFTTLASLQFSGDDLDATIDVVSGTIDFTVPMSIEGGLHHVIITVPQLNPGLNVPGLDAGMSNTLDFRVTPVLTSITPLSGVPGQKIFLEGDGFSPGIQVRFGGRMLSLARSSNRTANFDLPFWEDIGLPAGTQQVQVVNPDGSESNPLTFDLSLVYVVRMKAWRVYPNAIVATGGSGSVGTNREIGEIHNILVDDSNSPRNVWLPYGISLELDPNIENAYFPPDLAESVPYGTDMVAATRNSPGPDGKIYADPEAINFYFVSAISDHTTNAYTLEALGDKPPAVVVEDYTVLTTAKAAIVASHEVGHCLTLPHVCSIDQNVDNPVDTTFGRMCKDPSTETTDREYLMYPSEDFIRSAGVAITNQEAVVARKGALALHHG